MYKMEERLAREVAPKPGHERKQSIDDYCNFLLQRETKAAKAVTHPASPNTVAGGFKPGPSSTSK